MSRGMMGDSTTGSKVRADPGWQDRIAAALGTVARPIAADARVLPRRADSSPEQDEADARRFDRANFPIPRAAATLLLIYPHHGELVIPLTVRREDLRKHAGEISLPGGAVDDTDATAEDAALREAEEEIGLVRSAVRIIGRLDPVWIPVSNFELVPVVAVADRRPALIPAETEVAAVVELPLAVLLAPDGVTEEEITVPGATLRVGVYRWEGHRVWGATARTLAMLGAALSTPVRE